MQPNSPPGGNVASSGVVLEVPRRTEAEDSPTAPLESPEEFLVDSQETQKKEDDRIPLFPVFGKFNGDHQKPEDDLQHKENGFAEFDGFGEESEDKGNGSGIQLTSRFGEFDGFGGESEDQHKGKGSGFHLTSRFGEFDGFGAESEDDSQHKGNGSGIQLTTRIGELDGAGATKPSGFGGRVYPESMFSFSGNEGRSEFGGVVPESIPDVNIYQQKKTVAQGMMDLALFSANANQLRYVLESKEHPYFWAGVVFIVTSLLLQVAIGCGLLLNTRYNVKDKKEICIANRINNFTIVGIFLVTVMNVFICAFGVASGAPAAIFIGPRSGDFNDTGTESEEIFANQSVTDASIL